MVIIVTNLYNYADYVGYVYAVQKNGFEPLAQALFYLNQEIIFNNILCNSFFSRKLFKICTEMQQTLDSPALLPSPVIFSPFARSVLILQIGKTR